MRPLSATLLVGSFLLIPACPTLAQSQHPVGQPRTTTSVVPEAGIRITDAWARASAGNAATGAAYFTITAGAMPDRLTGAKSPVAATAEVHETTHDDGVMKMRAVPALTLEPGKPVTLAPGGYHLMLMGLKQPLKAGDSFPLELSFEKAQPITVTVKVQALGAHGSEAHKP